MTFEEWLFEPIYNNPYYPGQWKFLHILTLIICISLILGFYFLVKYSKNQEKTKKIIIYTLCGLIIFFEIMSRFVYFVRKYHYNSPDMVTYTPLWIILPKPWCAISCWLLSASIFVKKKFFYGFASMCALLCSVIYFIYPGTGFTGEYIMWSNLYSIATHALLLTTSITLITLKFAEFKFKDLWKVAIGFGITYAYGLFEELVLGLYRDPLYFMPGGDIQAGILGIDWGLYFALYIILIIVYICSFHLIGDKETVKKFLNKNKQEALED